MLAIAVALALSVVTSGADPLPKVPVVPGKKPVIVVPDLPAIPVVPPSALQSGKPEVTVDQQVAHPKRQGESNPFNPDGPLPESVSTDPVGTLTPDPLPVPNLTTTTTEQAGNVAPRHPETPTEAQVEIDDMPLKTVSDEPIVAMVVAVVFVTIVGLLLLSRNVGRRS